jgi:hypothetical protein
VAPRNEIGAGQRQDSGRGEDHPPDEGREADTARNDARRNRRPYADRDQEVIGFHRFEVGEERHVGRGHCHERRLKYVGDQDDRRRGAFEAERNAARRDEREGDRQNRIDQMHDDRRRGHNESQQGGREKIDPSPVLARASQRLPVHPRSGVWSMWLRVPRPRQIQH